MLCLNFSVACLCFILCTNWEVLLVLTYGFPDDRIPGVPKHVARKLCVDCF